MSDASQPTSSGSPAPAEKSKEELPKVSIAATFKEAVMHLYAFYDLNQELFHQQNTLPESYQSLAVQLNALGLKTKQNDMRWTNLINASSSLFPFILEAEDGTYHWVISSDETSLQNIWFNRTIPFTPPKPWMNPSFRIFRVKASDKNYVLPLLSKTALSLNWFVRILVEEWGLTVQMVVLAFFIQIFSLGLPIFSMVIFDRVFGHQSISTLQVMGYGVLLLIVGEMILQGGRSLLLTHYATVIDKFTAQFVLEKVLESPTNVNRRFRKDVIASGKDALFWMSPQNLLRLIPERFREIFKFNRMALSLLLRETLDTFFALISIVFLLLLDTPLGLISLLPLVAIAIQGFLEHPLLKRQAVKTIQTFQEFYLKLSEIIIQLEGLYSVHGGASIKRILLRKLRDFLPKTVGPYVETNRSSDLQSFFTNISSIITLFVGAHKVLEGTLSFGVYMAVTLLSRQIIDTIQRFMKAFGHFLEEKEETKVFRELVSLTAAQGKKDYSLFAIKQADGDVQLVNIDFRYIADNPNAPSDWIFKGFSLSIQPKEKIALVGPSGSGKTTLVRLLQRIHDPLQGYITLDGWNVADLDLENLRKQIGVVTQKPVLFSGSVYENLILGNPFVTQQQVEEVLALLELDYLLPTLLEKNIMLLGDNFSCGEVARLAVARVLLKNPAILVVDNCLTQLEPSLQERIYQKLFQRFESQTSLLITHSPWIHQHVDRILVLDKGKIVESGTFQELSQKEGLYSTLYSSRI